MRGGAIALGLIGAAALLPQAASAGSIQSRGDFSGTWTRFGPSDHWRHGRHYYGAPVYVAPAYAYDLDYGEPDYYGPPAIRLRPRNRPLHRHRLDCGTKPETKRRRRV